MIPLKDEDTEKVYMKDLPETSEYSHIIYDAQKVGKLLSHPGSFKESQAINSRVWFNIINLMASCIARGMRLQKEQSEYK